MNKIIVILKRIRPDADFEGSENFIEDGLLDSFDVVELISQLENKFDIIIDDMQIVEESFYSVESIAELIRKSGGEV